MTNAEKYTEEMVKAIKINHFKEFFDEHIKPHFNCRNYLDLRTCGEEKAAILTMLWLAEEYKEPEVDWTQVEVDTPILVRDAENRKWERRHFAKYENGKVYAYNDGFTSYTIEDKACITKTVRWEYAKLAEV